MYTELSHLLVPRAEIESKLSKQIIKGRKLLKIQITVFNDLDKAEQEYKAWSTYNEIMLSRYFTDLAFSSDYNDAKSGIGMEPKRLEDYIDIFRMKTEAKLISLKSIKKIIDLLPEPYKPEVVNSLTSMNQSVSSLESSKKKIFLVHGHDEVARETVARFLEKMSLEVIILHEKAGEGRTIIEKFEHNSNVAFAVVLLTPDDVGAPGKSKEDIKPRARQNVILELGYFIGKLGRNYVCALNKGTETLDLPSDILGVSYVKMDDDGAWKIRLGNELRSAGLDIDLNKI